MTVFTLGSINIDHIYRLARLPAPGETIAVLDYLAGLGGKGANQSVAAARAGAPVVHVGAIGPDGEWARDSLAAEGIDTRHITAVSEPTGHAIVMLDGSGENSILVHAGANRAIPPQTIDLALSAGVAGDILLLQNETTQQDVAARAAQARGMRVLYSAAPFDISAVTAVLPHVDILLMNAVEAEQLVEASGGQAPNVAMIVTRGGKGADWIPLSGSPVHVAAFPADPVDTTGAGDCFAGVLAAGLAAGLDVPDAMRRAAAAAAIQITRPGAAAAMPTAAEIDAGMANG